MESYDEHRVLYGSLKGKTGKEYSDGMNARISFCRKAINQYMKDEYMREL